MISSTKTFDQFMCDFFREDDMVEINAKWLQDKLRGYETNQRLQLAQIAEYKRIVERLHTKVEIMNLSKQIEEIENNVVYRVDVRA